MEMLTKNWSIVNLEEGEQPKQDCEIPDQDRGLQQYRAHLDASQSTYNALCSDIIETERIHTALTIWIDILQQ